MPSIPTYDSPQVELKPLPGVQQSSVASPSLFAAGAQQQQRSGGQLMASGNELAGAALAMQQRENADSIFRAETALKNDYLTYEQSARERRGQSAWGLARETADWFDKQTAAHSGNLGNAEQKRIFSQTAARLREQGISTMSSFESEQRRVSLAESATASITSSINLAAASAKQWGEPVPEGGSDPVSAAKGDVIESVAKLGNLNGWSPERRQAEEAQQLTNLHAQVIQNLADSDPTKARAYYAANKAEINGSQYNTIDSLLKMSGLKERAQQFSDKLTQNGATEADGFTAIRNELKGVDQEAAALEWKTRWREQTIAREADQASAADDAYKIFANTGRLSAIPSATLQRMDGRVLLALQHEAKLKAEDQLPATDWDKYYSLRQLAFDNPAAFARRDLRQDFTYLGKGEREGMIDLQARVNKPDEMKDVATLESQLSNVHDQLNWGSGDREKKGLFDTAVQNAINSEEKVTGRKLNFEQRQKVIDRFVVEGDTNGKWMPFGDKRYYEVQGTPDEAKFAPTIPKAERAKIEDALRRNGLGVDDATVSRLYRKKMGLQ